MATPRANGASGGNVAEDPVETGVQTNSLLPAGSATGYGPFHARNCGILAKKPPTSSSAGRRPIFACTPSPPIRNLRTAGNAAEYYANGDPPSSFQHAPRNLIRRSSGDPQHTERSACSHWSFPGHAQFHRISQVGATDIASISPAARPAIPLRSDFVRGNQRRTGPRNC